MMVKLRCYLRTVLLIAMGLSWFSGAMADLNDGLVAYYPFDGNANDESGNGNHGTVYGATLTEDRFGNTNNAYDFDGVNDYINATISTSNSFTITAWLNPDGATEQIEEIFERADNFNFEYRSGKLAQYTYQNDLLFSNTNLNVNTWNFVVLSRTPTEVSFYLNGEYDGGGGVSSSIALSGTYNIGSRTGTLYQFDGIIDEIRIYNRAFSKSEVQQLYQMDNQPSENCWATYENGNLHIPCVKVKGPFDDDLHFEADMQYESLSEPMTFQVTGAKPK